MLRHRITLFRLLGFSVRIDATWILLALFITWSLAQGFFPVLYPQHGTAAYWWMGISGALGLFLSIIFHEFSHSLVARRYGLPIKGITLFIFGGVAEMDEEPPNAKSEFLMAVAGPIASIVLAVLFFGVYQAAGAAAWPDVVVGVAYYLAIINALLAAFNLFPAFPLDGGRMLRAALWHFQGSLRRATAIASRVGGGFGMFLILMGIFSVMTGNFLGGIWWFLIGLFIMNAANMSYQQVLMRQALQGEPVRRFMSGEPVAVPAGTSLQAWVDDYVYRYYYKLYPVTEDGHVVGCVHTGQAKRIPREEWRRHTVGEVATPLSEDNSIQADADAMKALSLMTRTGASRLLVMDDGKLAGLIALKDLLKFFQLKVDLEEEGGGRRWFER